MLTFAGIDSSNRTHLVQIIDDVGNSLQEFEISNDAAGFKDLAAQLEKYGASGIGIELTHGPIIEFLHERGFRIFSVNPLQIRRFKDIYLVSGDKNDSIDALAIARYVAQRHNSLQPLVLSSPELEKLKVLGISHDRMVQERTRIANRLRFVLRQYYPLLDTLFSSVTAPILSHFLLRFPRWEILSESSDVEIQAFLNSKNYRVRKNVERVLQKIRAYQHCISETTEIALAIEAQALAQMMLLLQSEISQIEAEMKTITDAHRLGAVVQSLPAVGDLLAAKLLGLLGDNPARFQGAGGFQALMGTAPTNYQSGSYHKVTMRRACNKRGRDILFQFAFSTLRQSTWARSYYDVQRKRGKTHSAAVRALSNKWAGILFRLWQRGEPYEENKRPVAVVA